MRNPKDSVFPWRRSQDHGGAAEHPIIIVAAGPVGLVAALDLASKGHRTVVIDKKAGLCDGSRAICWSKRTLEIMHRLGVAEALLAKGVTWNKGKVFCSTALIYEF